MSAPTENLAPRFQWPQALYRDPARRRRIRPSALSAWPSLSSAPHGAPRAELQRFPMHTGARKATNRRRGEDSNPRRQQY